MAHLNEFLTQYGYFAIFGLLMLGIVGPLIPDETILIASGIFVHRGQLHFLPAVAAAFAGSLCGISLSYAIGFYGYEWTGRHWPTFHRYAQAHIIQAERWFLRFGRWALFVGYYIAGVRHFTALFAGISRMPFRTFAISAYSGALCWTVLFLSIGYFAGEQWGRISGTVDRWIVGVVLAACTISIVVWNYRRKARH